MLVADCNIFMRVMKVIACFTFVVILMMLLLFAMEMVHMSCTKTIVCRVPLSLSLNTIVITGRECININELTYDDLIVVIEM